MKIAGIQKVSLVDYPGKVSCVIFTQGCMFRCRFCHNGDLIDVNKTDGLISESEVFEFLRKRVGKLEAVVVSGGEPAIQSGLVQFMKKIKELGFAVKLDTTGYFPNVIRKAVNEQVVDYVAMDVKAPLEKYDAVNQTKTDMRRIEESIEYLMTGKIDYEFRTTIAKELTSKDDVYQIAGMIKGAKRYILQKFNPYNPLDASLKNTPMYSDEEFAEMCENVRDKFEECFVR